jgi:hypothetical protein
VEDTPPSENDSIDEKSTEENNEEETHEELSAKSRILTHSLPESSKSCSRKSGKIRINPTNQYPALNIVSVALSSVCSRRHRRNTDEAVSDQSSNFF